MKWPLWDCKKDKIDRQLGDARIWLDMGETRIAKFSVILMVQEK